MGTEASSHTSPRQAATIQQAVSGESHTPEDTLRATERREDVCECPCSPFTGFGFVEENIFPNSRFSYAIDIRTLYWERNLKHGSDFQKTQHWSSKALKNEIED